jgi:hypothetical protein
MTLLVDTVVAVVMDAPWWIDGTPHVSRRWHRAVIRIDALEA